MSVDKAALTGVFSQYYPSIHASKVSSELPGHLTHVLGQEKGAKVPGENADSHSFDKLLSKSL